MMAPLDETVDHVRGPATARLPVEYGDYECPYSRQAFREIERLERRLPGGLIDGVVHLGGCDAATLTEALAR